MISAIVSRLVILLFGTLYPAYASYKAVRTKSGKEYVKWMMYWIVFAFFTCIETFTDLFISWFPFYYEVKVVLVIWLLSPATKGSSVLYRKFVHPMLTRREEEIDEYLNQAKERGYSAVLQLGSRGVNYATNVIMKTALKTFASQNNPNAQRMLTSSQSDYGIYTTQGRDTYDGGDDVIVPRSQSLNSINEFSDDENHAMEMEEIINEDEVLGAARSREPPKRKTRILRTRQVPKKQNGSKVPIRGRRKIREEESSDLDVDIE